jgi:hypothetical protein
MSIVDIYVLLAKKNHELIMAVSLFTLPISKVKKFNFILHLTKDQVSILPRSAPQFVMMMSKYNSEYNLG